MPTRPAPSRSWASPTRIAKMVIDDINARRPARPPVELFLEDSATDDSAAAASAAKLVAEVDVDVVLGGIYSSTRRPSRARGRRRGGSSTSTPSSTRDRSPTR